MWWKFLFLMKVSKKYRNKMKIYFREQRDEQIKMQEYFDNILGK